MPLEPSEPGGLSTKSHFGNPQTNHTKDDTRGFDDSTEENSAIAARIKARNESHHFSLCGATNTSTATIETVSEDPHPNTIHDQNLHAAALIKKKNEETHFCLFGALPSSTSSSVGSAISSNAFASASTTNSYNVITDRPTSRVIQPPGGKTSITLG